MASSIILVIVSAVGLYCGLHCIANNMGMSKLHNSKEYLIEARNLSKDIKSEVLDPCTNIDTDSAKNSSNIFNKSVKLDNCVMIKYGNNDYRYLSNLKEYGLEELPSSIGIYVRIYKGIILINKGYTPNFYIDRARLIKIDRDLYGRLVQVESINADDMSDYNQRSIDTLRELFKRVKLTNNSEIDKYINIGRSLEYKFHM